MDNKVLNSFLLSTTLFISPIEPVFASTLEVEILNNTSLAQQQV